MFSLEDSLVNLQFNAWVDFFKLSAYLAKLQARAWLSHALCAPAKTQLKDEESARNNHVFGCNFAIYSPILNFFHYQAQQ